MRELSMTDAVQVTTTTAQLGDAERIARTLLRRRLAACVQVSGPISSYYHWQGKLESGQEWLCTIKTLRSHYGLVESAIRQLHTYELPEILAVPIIAGSADYLVWLAGELCPLSTPPPP
jgi:periplasmic divalent cation tolerance protein